MRNFTLCLGTSSQFDVPVNEQIRLFRAAGFNAFFTGWSKESPFSEWRKYADSIGMIYQSVHGPYRGCADMWGDDDEKAQSFVTELIDCVHDCENNCIPIMVSHTYIGFGEHPVPSEKGLERFYTVVKEAQKSGVKIAFENTEGEEFLAALLNSFTDSNVGFCLDTGHAMCYNPDVDLFSLYGDRLIATHLNDNLGVRSTDGKIGWIDDLHLLPFDGIANWDKITDNLKKYHYSGILTFELITQSKPLRHENDCYTNMPLELYLAECYKRACKIAAKMDDSGFLY